MRCKEFPYHFYHSTHFLLDHSEISSSVQKVSTNPRQIDVLPLKSDIKRKELFDKLEATLDSVVSDDSEASWKFLWDPAYSVAFEVLGLSIWKHLD